MATLKLRIKAIEERLNPNVAAAPLFFVTLDRGNPSKPYSVEYDGETWTQEKNETFDEFRERAKAGALRHRPPIGRFAVIFLCATRPSFTEEEWLELYPDKPGEPWDSD